MTDDELVGKFLLHMRQRAQWLNDRANIAAQTEGDRVSLKSASLVLENLAYACESTARDFGTKL